MNRAVAECLWTQQWRNVCEQSSGGIFVNRAVTESLWEDQWRTLWSGQSRNLYEHSSAVWDHTRRETSRREKTSISLYGYRGACRSVWGSLWHFCTETERILYNQNISALFTTFFSDTKSKATLEKRHLRGRNKANSRNVVCNILGTFNVVCSEYAKLHTSAVKGSALPLQAWSGPEGSRKLRFPNFMTTAQDGGKVIRTHRTPLLPGNTAGTHFC
jgi:hypothetical protein